MPASLSLRLLLPLAFGCASPPAPTDSPRSDSGDPPFDTAPVEEDGGSDGDGGQAPVDADSDGSFAEDDCDDTDASIYPGAEEVPWDGIDQDCSGADLVDVDGDGDAATQAGGGDCDDLDPLVNLAAAEVCDNGKDDNCDGSATGCLFGAEAEIGSLAAAGASPNALVPRSYLLGDVDGDGHGDVGFSGWAESASGGRSNAWVFAGPVSGNLVLDSADAMVEGFLFTGGLRGYTEVVGAGDINGDGVADLALGEAWADVSDHPYGGRVLLFQGPVDSDTGEVQAWASIEGTRDESQLGWRVRSIPDQDGDGVSDLAVTSSSGEVSDSDGELLIFNGPMPRGAYVPADADARVYGGENAYLGHNLAIADVDGDGRDDVVVSELGAYRAGVLLGPLSGSSTLDDGAALIETGEGRYVMDLAVLEAPGMVSRVALGTRSTDGVARVEVVDVPLAGIVDATLSDTVVEASAAGDAYDVSSLASSDLNGDGSDDLIIACWSYATATSQLWTVTAYTALAKGAHDLEDADMVTWWEQGDYFGVQVTGGSDATGDVTEDMTIAHGGFVVAGRGP